MSERLGLRRLVGRQRRGEHYETEDEQYADLRDAVDDIDADERVDLTAYADTATRQHDAFCYIDLAPALLERAHVDEGDWPAA